MNYAAPYSFRQVLQDAIADVATRGYVSAEQIDYWRGLLRNAAERETPSEAQIDAMMRDAMGAIFRREIDNARIVRRVPGVSRYSLAMVRPQLRGELDRRIMASADLIKIRRKDAIEKTLARFAGWSTSIPAGSYADVDKRKVKADIGKGVAQFRYERARVATDQGHKLVANVAEIVALDSGAIAAIWHDRGEHDRNYDARKEHLARSGKLFLVKDSWAIREGLVRLGSRPYTDEIERPGQLVFCSCFYEWITSPRRLPDDCMTRKGHAWLADGGQRKAA